jgi:heme o synthase
VSHTGGAAALVVLMTGMLTGHPHRATPGGVPELPHCRNRPDDAAPSSTTSPGLSSTWRQFYILTKPRVIQLIVFCALIGMVLAVPGLPDWPQVQLAAAGLRRHLAGGRCGGGLQLRRRAADRRQDEAHRLAPHRQGRADQCRPWPFRPCSVRLGSAILYLWVNPLTMWLTFATFVGYAVIYTVILKPLTPQNIVIGGASGAMPPVLGWAAMTGNVAPEALILFLIIFLWTPPHFWALALYRVEDYRKSGLPMLPVTHGSEFTRLQILLYTLVLFAACLVPFMMRMSGWFYLAAAVLLNAGFVAYAFVLWRDYSDALARKTFRFSLIHLSLLFAALLIDHYLP